MSCSGDRSLKVWDVRQPGSVQNAVAHAAAVLCADWDKYSPNIVTSSADQAICIWDQRNLERPLQFLTGHTLAVRKVKYSPYFGNILASASYDMTVRIWDLNQQQAPNSATHSHHSEFVVGLDFNLFDQK